ncbi:MAG: hypothetical protein P4K98_02255 [Bryobacteraceae bacterium]|nr:hypothetical protein [Bryobacteraceae bacterium]
MNVPHHDKPLSAPYFSDIHHDSASQSLLSCLYYGQSNVGNSSGVPSDTPSRKQHKIKTFEFIDKASRDGKAKSEF